MSANSVIRAADRLTSMHAARRREALGWLLGLLGVLAFSLTLPMTRFAVAELDPWFLAFGRMALAGLIALAWLALTRAPWPAHADVKLLAVSALGIVVGFPLLSSLALREIPANHGAIIVGMLPFATAVVAALTLREKHSRRFWICAFLGSALVVAFALRDGVHAVGLGDAWMFGAVLAGAVGYVAGGRLAARMGGVAAILWALVFALPLTAPVAIGLALIETPHASWPAWGAFAYVTVISQTVGFFAWYNGLALGGIARVGQVQLLQAFFTLGAAAVFFGEDVTPITWLCAAAVVATIAIGRMEKRAT
ncbi:MAG TPA: DMT family transporter [Burkholderiaceae bacterium]|nr:DMT family transporter [Burkholderiaceae bacterium]